MKNRLRRWADLRPETSSGQETVLSLFCAGDMIPLKYNPELCVVYCTKSTKDISKRKKQP